MGYTESNGENEEGTVVQVGGIAPGQHLDRYITQQVEDQLSALPGSGKFLERLVKIKQLNEIQEKMERGEGLGGEELCFLYEVDGRVTGIRNSTDPRVQGLIDQRDRSKDLFLMIQYKGYKSEDELGHFFEKIHLEMERRRRELRGIKKITIEQQQENEAEWRELASEKIRESQRKWKREEEKERSAERWSLIKYLSIIFSFTVSSPAYTSKIEANEKIACQQMSKGEPLEDGKYWSIYLGKDGPRANLSFISDRYPVLVPMLPQPFPKVRPEDAQYVADLCNSYYSYSFEGQLVADDVRRGIVEIKGEL